MSLLTLCDPGSCARVGVSKPVGASVGPCCAMPATTIASAPSAKTANEIHLRNIDYLRNRFNLVRTESEATLRQHLHLVHNRGTRAFIPAGLLKVCESHYLLPKETPSAQLRARVCNSSVSWNSVVNVLRWAEFFLGETGLRRCKPKSVYMRLTLFERVGEVTKTGSNQVKSCRLSARKPHYVLLRCIRKAHFRPPRPLPYGT